MKNRPAGHSTPVGFECFSWWTRSQRIRTEGEVPFEAALLQAEELPVYQRIAEEAAHLRLLGMNANRIAAALKVDRTTVVRALRWIKGKPTSPDRRQKNT